mgnify:FL=1
MTAWIGQVIVMVVLVGGGFLMGVSVSDRKQGKR